MTKQRRDDGFTLIELLVVIAILGLLIALVAPAVLSQLGNAKGKIAAQSIERLDQILDLYKLDVGSYPNTEDGLQALITKPSDADNWSGPYVHGSGLPVDPWGHAFTYREPSDRDGHDYDLCSPGPTGTPGSSTEICNK